jgi:hypothetical protein
VISSIGPALLGLEENFALVDGQEVLAQLGELPITTWNYKAGAEASHMSPTVRDFYAAFGLGEDDKNLRALDTNGVALVANQGLRVQSQALQAQNAAQRAQIDDLTARLKALERALSTAEGAESDDTASSSPLQGGRLRGVGMLMLVAAAVWGARRRGDLR